MAAVNPDNVKSMLPIGATVDLSSLSLDEPYGESVDWVSIHNFLEKIKDVNRIKLAYLLTVRGQKQKKISSGTRVRFFGKEDLEIYITFATGVTSVQATELTPGRFRTAVAGLVFKNPQLRVSPVMSVIGFNKVVDGWDQIKAKLPGDETQNATTGYKPASKTEAYPAEGKGISGIERIDIDFTDNQFPKLFSLAPDRVPPTAAGKQYALELGAALALCQDMRNRILTSVEAGTTQQKNRARSELHHSYVRRSMAMGYHVDKAAWENIYPAVLEQAVPGFVFRTATINI